MILRAVDGSVELVGSRITVGIPKSGDVRYVLDGGAGGQLNVTWLPYLCVDDQSGRVILVVGEDELVITSPRTLEVTSDGKVALTLAEYVQESAAFPAIGGAKLVAFEERIAALTDIPETLTALASKVNEHERQIADLTGGKES